MVKWTIGWLSAAGVGLVLMGCHGTSWSFRYAEHESRPVRRTYVQRHHGHVEVTHICTDGCGHYYDGATFVVLHGHRHGHGCGHAFDGAYWVLARPHKSKRVPSGIAHLRRTRHMHGPSCGCVFNRSGHKWVKVRAGHVHGHGCGHVHINGRWSLRW